MSKQYTSITIIYNPHSTGAGAKIAHRLHRRLEKRGIDPAKIHTMATKYAGHAEILAYEAAKGSKKPLVISSSGDGGYHEIVNGVMRARNEGSKAVTGLLPGGNANDHYKNLHDEAIESQILQQSQKVIDLLQVTVEHPVHAWDRYVHSYAGIGLTAKVGIELNKTKLNPLNQIWIFLRAFYKFRAIEIMVHGKAVKYDSVIWSNVNTMSGLLSISEVAAINDGKFELTTFRSRNKIKLLNQLLRAATYGLNGRNHKTQYVFHTIKPVLIQLDGETRMIAANSKVTVRIVPRTLACVI